MPAVLRVATTTFVRPGWFAFGSRPVPWVDALFCVFLPACAGLGSFAVRVERQTPGCCFRRSHLLRLLFPRRREVLPSSRITPLNACPDLRPRWCPACLPCRRQDCCLPDTGSRRLSVRLPGPIHCPSHTFFGAQFRGLRPRLPSASHTVSRRSHFGSATDRWLAFGRVGLIGSRRRTSRVTLTSFKGCHRYSIVPGFSSRQDQ